MFYVLIEFHGKFIHNFNIKIIFHHKKNLFYLIFTINFLK